MKILSKWMITRGTHGYPYFRKPPNVQNAYDPKLRPKFDASRCRQASSWIPALSHLNTVACIRWPQTAEHFGHISVDKILRWLGPWFFSSVSAQTHLSQIQNLVRWHTLATHWSGPWNLWHHQIQPMIYQPVFGT